MMKVIHLELSISRTRGHMEVAQSSSPDPMTSVTAAPEPFPQLTCVAIHGIPNNHLMQEEETQFWFMCGLA